MTLIKKIALPEKNGMSDQSIPQINATPSDELTVHLRSTQILPSCMPESLKLEKRKNAPSLPELLNETVLEKGKFESSSTHWISQDEVEIKGLSQQDLHSFLLKAEALGKTVQYSKTFTVKISD